MGFFDDIGRGFNQVIHSDAVQSIVRTGEGIVQKVEEQAPVVARTVAAAAPVVYNDAKSAVSTVYHDASSGIGGIVRTGEGLAVNAEKDATKIATHAEDQGAAAVESFALPVTIGGLAVLAFLLYK